MDDVFVTRVNPSGASLTYSTFIGGKDFESAYATMVDADGTTTVAGVTQSVDFPTTPGSYQPQLRGPVDSFLARVNPTGSKLAYGTFLGGDANDEGFSVAPAGPGLVVAAGWTTSANFPTTVGAFDRTWNGHIDAFAATLQIARTLHVASIDPIFRPDGPGYDVGARIGIAYSNGARAAGALVSIEIDYPDGSTSFANAKTGPNGVATVFRRVSLTGTYSFTVLTVSKPPAIYDQTANVETSDSITIPPGKHDLGL